MSVQVERVTLADLRKGDVVWSEDNFYPVVAVDTYPEYVGFTINAERGPSRLTGVASNPILRVAA